MKLVGPISPTGEHNEDQRRLANLKVLTDLIDGLICDLVSIEQSANSIESSVKMIGQHAHKSLNNIASELVEAGFGDS